MMILNLSRRLGTKPICHVQFINSTTTNTKIKQFHLSGSVGCQHSQENVRVRFAPSPTGNMHLGGFRTAFYNYIFAKSFPKGKFILRIEDTDDKRLQPDSSDSLEDILNWAGLLPDESPTIGGQYEPYSQSQRQGIYSTHVQTLLNNGSAYKCFCSPERLANLKKQQKTNKQMIGYDRHCLDLDQQKISDLESSSTPYCVRFKLGDEIEKFHDLIRGDITHNIAKVEGDPVILRENNSPTYHLANVIDDHLMDVTHVLRGQEWLLSTPKHLMIYRAFGWGPPIYGHLPLLINKNGEKLSKRNNDFDVQCLRKEGFSPKALINFVKDVGGGFGRKENDNLLSIEELIEKFDISTVVQRDGIIDLQMLEKYSRQHMLDRLVSDDERPQVLAEAMVVLNNEYGDRLASLPTPDYITKVLQWSELNILHLQQLTSEKLSYLWIAPETSLIMLPELSVDHSILIEEIIKSFQSLSTESFDHNSIVEVLNGITTSLHLKKGPLYKYLRIILINSQVGPPVGSLISLLGQERSIDRLRNTLELLKDKSKE